MIKKITSKKRYVYKEDEVSLSFELESTNEKEMASFLEMLNLAATDVKAELDNLKLNEGNKI